jgi:histidyl-tRNA synthetase
LPQIWDQQTFIDKAGYEIINQMYSFDDKADRKICLIPEGTALIQKVYNEDWSKNKKKPVKIFYETKCYRYERPQAGRYREFTQFGVELLGGKQPEDKLEIIEIAKNCLSTIGVQSFDFNDMVKRGLSYYIEDGFEAEVSSLGAQKQILGGGRYKEGIGFAVGIDRAMLAI